MNKVTVLVDGKSNPLDEGGGKYEVAGTCTLIRGDDAIVVADPGMVTDRAVILEPLHTEGISPEEVTHVFISHHHPDHTVNIALFPNAKVVDYHAAYEGEIWQYHEGNEGGEHRIAPGITVLLTPGHSEEDASLIVETNEGIYTLTHAWWHSDMTPEKDPVAWDQKNSTKAESRF